jgi:hypothetical protein
MRRDEVNAFRALLEDEPPRLTTYVNTPWDAVPDLPAYNAGAYRLIERRLKAMSRRAAAGEAVPTQGILVLGEAGTGKTHLLMRVAHALSATNPVMFIHKPNNEEAVAQHVWSHLIESLTRHVPGLGAGQSQLDHLLSHVFTAVLVPLLELDVTEGLNAKQKQRWLGQLKESPRNLFEMLESGPNRQKHLDFLRNKVLAHLRIYHPDVDQTIARALMNYCFLANDRDRRAMLTWLMGQQVDESTMRRLGVNPLWSEPLDETASDIHIRQEREHQAIIAIRTIGDLSRYYHKPLILAFDQLEGLRGERRLTQRWADVVQQVFTVAPNLLVVTCVFPSLWETWFSQELHQAVKDRIAQDQITLDRFGPEHAEGLLRVHLADSVAKHRLPDPLYPFEAEDIRELCAQASSPRSFLQKARTRLEDWLDDEEVMAPAVPVAAPLQAPVPAAAMAPEPVADVAEAPVPAPSETAALSPEVAAIRDAYEAFYAQRLASHEAGIPNEEDLFGRIARLARALASRLGGARVLGGPISHGQRVVPPNVIFRGEPSLCLGVSNSQGASLKARLENLTAVLIDGRQCRKAILVRDGRCPSPTGQGEALWNAIADSHGATVILDAAGWAGLYALTDLLTSLEQQDLSVEGRPIPEGQALNALAGLGVLERSAIPTALTREASWLVPALRAGAEVGGAPEPTEASDPASDMQPELGDLIKALFPGDPIRAGAAPLPPLLDVPTRAAFWPSSAPAEEAPDGGRTNRGHAELLARLVEQALARGIAPGSILVLAPYAAQAGVIRSAIGDPGVRVSHAPESEGDADLVLIDFTDDGLPSTDRTADRDWLRGALRRARRQVAFAGNPAYLTNFRNFPVADLVLFRALLSRAPVIREAAPAAATA